MGRPTSRCVLQLLDGDCYRRFEKQGPFPSTHYQQTLSQAKKTYTEKKVNLELIPF